MPIIPIEFIAAEAPLDHEWRVAQAMKYYDRAYVIASDTGCVSAGLFLSHSIPFRDARLIVERMVREGLASEDATPHGRRIFNYFKADEQMSTARSG